MNNEHFVTPPQPIVPLMAIKDDQFRFGLIPEEAVNSYGRYHDGERKPCLESRTWRLVFLSESKAYHLRCIEILEQERKRFQDSLELLMS